MEKRRLGSSDLEITPIGFGAWAAGGGGYRFGWGEQDDAEGKQLLESQTATIGALARSDKIEIVPAIPEEMIAARGVVRGVQIAIPLEGLLDLDGEAGSVRLVELAAFRVGADERVADLLGLP